MANLRVNKIAAPIVKDEFTGSVYFDGVNDGLIIQDNDDFNFGSGDFCMEMFIYPKSYSPSGYSYFMGQYGTSYTTFWSMASEKNDCFFYYGLSNIRISGTYTIPLNAWTHVAVTREGNTIRLFTNGSLDASGTFTHTLNDASVNFTIGKDSANAYDFDGYVSNARVCKGHAVYTENFTVPTRELPVHTAPPKGVVFPAADNRTVLLACQSSTDATAEATGRHIITVDGDATAADANPGLIRKTNITSTITENTGSVFFDGTGDYLQVLPSDDLSLTGDFTVEYWTYLTGTENNMRQISSGNYYGGGYNGNWYFGLNATQNNIIFYTYDGQSNAESISIDYTPSLNTWYHIAAARVGNTVTIYINGVSVGSGTISKDLVDGAAGGLQIGRLVTYGDHMVISPTSVFAKDMQFIQKTSQCQPEN